MLHSLEKLHELPVAIFPLCTSSVAVYSFCKFARTKWIGWLPRDKRILSQFWGPEAQTQIAYSTPLKILEENPFSASFQWLLTVCGTPCLWMHHSNLCLYLPAPPLCLIVSAFIWSSSHGLFVFIISCSYKGNSYWISVHPNLAWLYLNFITSAKTLFPNTITFTGPRSEILIISLKGT